MPDALAADGRRLLSALTVAQLCDADGHAIAEQCISIVASGQRASIKDGPLADFTAIQDDGGDSGRRPRGLDDKRGGGRGGGNDKRIARSAGRGTGGKGSGNDKLKGCSAHLTTVEGRGGSVQGAGTQGHSDLVRSPGPVTRYSLPGDKRLPTAEHTSDSLCACERLCSRCISNGNVSWYHTVDILSLNHRPGTLTRPRHSIFVRSTVSAGL